jgi:hypothetical protein
MHGAGARTAGAAREATARSSQLHAGTDKAASGALELSPRNSQAQTDALQVAHNESLFGDNPLDSFATAGGELQLDLAHAPGFAARMTAANTGARVSQRASEHVASVVARARPRARSGSALWLLPAALLLAFVLLLVAPGLFSPAPPDLEAAARREAENPATRDRRPYRNAPRPKLADVAPALRELTF